MVRAWKVPPRCSRPRTSGVVSSCTTFMETLLQSDLKGYTRSHTLKPAPRDDRLSAIDHVLGRRHDLRDRVLDLFPAHGIDLGPEPLGVCQECRVSHGL